MASEVSGVELRDIASGKLARTVDPPAGYDILRRGPNVGPFELQENSASRRPCRAIVIAGAGELVIFGLDGQQVTLPDVGGAFQWNIQAIGVLSAGAPFTVIY